MIAQLSLEEVLSTKASQVYELDDSKTQQRNVKVIILCGTAKSTTILFI